MNATTADAGSATVTGQPQALRLRRSTEDKGAALYAAAWLLIPEDGTDQPVAAAWLAARRDRAR